MGGRETFFFLFNPTYNNMKENPHSENLKKLLYKYGQMNIFAWTITDWEAINENWTGFRINKIDFVGTFNVGEIRGTNLFQVVFQEDGWKMNAHTTLDIEQLVELLTKIGGHKKAEERAVGHRAPSDSLQPMSAN